MVANKRDKLTPHTKIPEELCLWLALQLEQC